jgi:hypothetical protein
MNGTDVRRPSHLRYHLSVERSAKLIFFGIATLTVFAALIAWSVVHFSMPGVKVNLRADANPVPENAATLNGADIEKILGVEQFRVIRRTSQVPQVVKESFSNFTHLPYDLADPGEEISSDMILSGKSSRRLVFLGVSGDSAVLFYEQGGFAGAFNVVVFWFGSGGHGWGATLEHGPVPKDIPTFRAAVKNGRFHAWQSEQ